MGRDRKNEQAQGHFTKMIRNTMQTPAWRALPPVAQALYPWIKLEWKGPEANNNGRISLSVRQAAQRLGVSTNTAARAFHQLQAKGFLVVTSPARLGVEGQAHSPTFEITEIALPHGEQRGGRRLYTEWSKNADFPVHKAAANNPRGLGPKTKPHLKIEDSTVAIFETAKRKASQK